MPFDDPEKQARYEAWLASKKTQEQGYTSSASEYGKSEERIRLENFSLSISPILVTAMVVAIAKFIERKRYLSLHPEQSYESKPLGGWVRLGIVLTTIWSLLCALVTWTSHLQEPAVWACIGTLLIWSVGWAVAWVRAGFRK